MGIDAVVRRAVFLDRDGVLNRTIMREGKPYPPAHLAELEILPGVPEALACLRSAGLLLVVATNQPDVARGKVSRKEIEAMEHRLRAHLPLDDIRACFHDDRDGCSCRKPQPGMLMQAAKDWQLDLTRSFMVGDRWKDIEAGRRAGCRTILLDRDYSERTRCVPDYSARSLVDAAEWILRVVDCTVPD